jgi:drug/metabolite transporter (DMT)-like permease
MDVPFGIACGLTGAISWGLVDSCATVASRRVGTLLTSTGMQVAALLPLLFLFIATGEPVPGDSRLVAQAALMGLISAIACLLTFQAFKLGPVAVASPVMSAYGGLGVVFAVALLGETLRPLQASGVVVATVGVALAGIVIDRRWRRSRPAGRGLPFAIGALVLWAATVIGFAGPIRELGWLPTLTISRLTSAAALLVVVGVSIARTARSARGPRSASRAMDRSPRLPVLPRDRTAALLCLAMGWLDVLGFSVWSVGLAATAAWLVGMVGSFAPIVSMTFGLVVLGERLRPNQWLGIAIVFSSIILIGAP